MLPSPQIHQPVIMPLYLLHQAFLSGQIRHFGASGIEISSNSFTASNQIAVLVLISTSYRDIGSDPPTKARTEASLPVIDLGGCF